MEVIDQNPNPSGQYSAPPKNWLVESILVTIFCCLPFGIVGIINAANVNSRWAVGDHEGARRASAEAGKWTKIGFYIGLAVILLYIVGVVLLGIGGGAAALMNMQDGAAD